MSAKPLRILFAAAEMAPFVKVGGLADVIGALPRALRVLGHDARVVIPAYSEIEGPRPLLEFDVRIRGGHVERAAVNNIEGPGGVPVYLIGSSRFFHGGVYADDPDAYIFFCRVAMELIPLLHWTPDVIHCNDWHTGLLPVYLETYTRRRRTARVFTIHNLAYQGVFEHEMMRRAGLPDRLFTYDKLEFFGKMSFMKGGLVFSDRVNTVSPTYAGEIQTPEHGCGLDPLLRYLASQGKLTGILNGIDDEEYDPAKDPRIPAHYDANDPSGKAICKAALQEEMGLPALPHAPLLGIVSRLADQKGLDLIAEASDRMAELPIQLVVLGTGDERYECLFREMERKNPEKVRARIGFDAGLGQRIYAGSDLFLMPSRFEPCGLGQLIALRYGSIPIVRQTGGLADTVTDHSLPDGNGFVFGEYEPGAMLDAIQRAIAAYGNKESWQGLVHAAMTADHSWKTSAHSYVELYRNAMIHRMRPRE